MFAATRKVHVKKVEDPPTAGCAISGTESEDEMYNLT